MRELSPEVLAADEPLTLLGRTELRDLVARARSVPRRRARILLHGTPDAILHEMVIVMTLGQYVPPHRNDRSSKSYLVVEGGLILVRFNETGEIVSHVRCEAGAADAPFLARLNLPTWHMIMPTSPAVVFIETILGPHKGTTYATWAPSAEDAEGGARYLNDVCSRCGLSA